MRSISVHSGSDHAAGVLGAALKPKS
jgi:hypothetical protein